MPETRSYLVISQEFVRIWVQSFKPCWKRKIRFRGITSPLFRVLVPPWDSSLEIHTSFLRAQWQNSVALAGHCFACCVATLMIAAQPRQLIKWLIWNLKQSTRGWGWGKQGPVPVPVPFWNLLEQVGPQHCTFVLWYGGVHESTTSAATCLLDVPRGRPRSGGLGLPSPTRELPKAGKVYPVEATGKQISAAWAPTRGRWGCSFRPWCRILVPTLRRPPGPARERVTYAHPGFGRPWPTCNPGAQSGHGAAGEAEGGRAQSPPRWDAALHLPQLPRRAPPCLCGGSALVLVLQARATATGVAGPASER